MWEVEWKKGRAEKENKELLNKKKNKEKEQAMYAAWGTYLHMYDEDDEDLALMTIEESETEPESDSEGTKVSLFYLKDKIVKFSKKKLSFLLLTSIDTIQELVKTKNQLLASMTSLKFEYINLEEVSSDLKKENQLLKEQVQQLDSCTLALKSEILKQSVTGNEKEKISCDQIRCDKDLMRLNNELSSERKNSRRMNLELSRIKTDLERDNN